MSSVCSGGRVNRLILGLRVCISVSESVFIFLCVLLNIIEGAKEKVALLRSTPIKRGSIQSWCFDRESHWN
jgi:hypothetical protein